jgi:hypothetical protein
LRKTLNEQLQRRGVPTRGHMASWVFSASVRFAAEVSIGLIVTSTLLAQSVPADKTAVIHPRDVTPALYREPMTQTDISLEWYAYTRLHTFVHAEDREPGLGVALAAQGYGLQTAQATALVQVLRDVKQQTDRLSPPVTVCSAGIASARDYVSWWAGYDEAVRSYRRSTIEILAQQIDPQIWQASLERAYLPWLRGDGLGDRINFQKQVDVADYTIWMRGWCEG